MQGGHAPPRGWGLLHEPLWQNTAENFYTIYTLRTKSFKKASRCASSLKHVYGHIDRLEVLTDEQIDELLAIVEDKKKALSEGAG